MKQYFKILLPVLLVYLGIFYYVGAAPAENIFRNLRPEANSTYEIGTTSAKWLRIYTDNASTTNLTVSGISGCNSTQALTTNVNGIVACGSITSSLSGGATNAMAFWTSATALSATSSPTIGWITATTTTASSTLQDLFWVDGQATSLTLSGAVSFGSINGTGVVSNANLANSTISGIALGSNLTDLTATNATLTFSGTYNGSTARTIGLNLANANTWTGGQIFGNTTTTAATSTSLYVSGYSQLTTLDVSGAATFPGGTTITCTSCITNTNVNDALTISGGTINNSAIGATTPLTGVFTLATTTSATSTNLYVSGHASTTLLNIAGFPVKTQKIWGMTLGSTTPRFMIAPAVTKDYAYTITSVLTKTFCTATSTPAVAWCSTGADMQIFHGASQNSTTTLFTTEVNTTSTSSFTSWSSFNDATVAANEEVFVWFGAASSTSAVDSERFTVIQVIGYPDP